MRLLTSHSKIISLLAAYAANPYLAAIRDGLTLTLPIIVTGTIVLLVNTFPFDPYQNLMMSLFGENWKMFGAYVSHGTFGMLSVIMALSIGHSLAEDYNTHNPLDKITPAIVSFVTFSSLICTLEPVNELGRLFDIRWLGVHGLLLAIVTSLFASVLFRFFYRFECLRMNIYSSSNRVSINQALGAMIPAALTIFVFAAYRVTTKHYGLDNPNEWLYTHLQVPFSSFGGQTLTAGNVYGFVRHLLWFVGIHGSNVLEPIMQEVYVTALNANVALKQAGVIDPREAFAFIDRLQGVSSPYAIFTKPFFDCYTSIGGAGATTGLLFASLLFHKDSSARKVSSISLIPSIFNVNELLLFGLPVVLNPIYFIPFVFVPIIITVVAYYATLWGLVPATTQEVAWNIPIFFSGYMATGSFAGSALQLVNLLVSVAVYVPFVKIDNQLRKATFKEDFEKLTKAAEEVDFMRSGAKLLSRPYPVGDLATNLALDLRHALRNKELYVEYQPQVDSNTGKVYGVESLMRWKHSTIGLIPPHVFIRIAEDTGFILELGYWGLEESIKQVADWRKRGITHIIMSVNVSVTQLEDEKFPDKLMAMLSRYNVPTENIRLEITESIALTAHMMKNTVIARLHACNIPLAIDDFGMGHSSITYLKLFPVSSLKADAILSKDVLTSNSSREIISSVADLCQSLHIDFVVEYVEDEEHLLQLRSLGCSKIQGFYYSSPLNPSDCISFILQTHKAYGMPTSAAPNYYI